MAATVVSFPPTPAAVYRPMQLHVQRNDPPGSQINWIKVADASDVSTYGNGLQVGQVFISHALIQGSIVLQAGQTLHIFQNAGPYLGVWTCINSFGSSPWYTIIDAPAMGDYTPSGSPTSALRVYLSNYTVLVKVSIYTNPATAPQQVVLRAQPIDKSSNIYINVDVVLKDYFNNKIDSFLKPMPGVPVQSAHGITANFYGLHVVEVYDSPDVDMTDPFDGTHTISEDDMTDFAEARVAVNAVHPYASEVIDWEDADLSDFIFGAQGRRLLTLASRGTVKVGGTVFSPVDGLPGVRLLAEPNDWMWAFALTDVADGFALAATLSIVDLSGASPSTISTTGIAIAGPKAAVAIGIGPANLGSAVLGLTKYAIVINDGTYALCEPIEVTVSPKCSENRRPFAWLNKLGGIDAHTFTGREVYSSKVKRATAQKPYNVGTGFDWTERTYRSEPQRTRTVSTRPLPSFVRRWLAEDLGESANVIALEKGIVAPCILLADEVQGGDTAPVRSKPFTVEYRLGVDNLSQQT